MISTHSFLTFVERMFLSTLKWIVMVNKNKIEKARVLVFALFPHHRSPMATPNFMANMYSIYWETYTIIYEEIRESERHRTNLYTMTGHNLCDLCCVLCWRRSFELNWCMRWSIDHVTCNAQQHVVCNLASIFISCVHKRPLHLKWNKCKCHKTLTHTQLMWRHVATRSHTRLSDRWTARATHHCAQMQRNCYYIRYDRTRKICEKLK